MNQTNAIICGVIKNSVDKLVANMNLAIKTGEQFNMYKIVIYENNSTDGTKDLLKKYETNQNIKYQQQFKSRFQNRMSQKMRPDYQTLDFMRLAHRPLLLLKTKFISLQFLYTAPRFTEISTFKHR
jgi:hypothetical protein